MYYKVAAKIIKKNNIRINEEEPEEYIEKEGDPYFSVKRGAGQKARLRFSMGVRGRRGFITSGRTHRIG